jgi:hypothetical protein
LCPRSPGIADGVGIIGPVNPTERLVELLAEERRAGASFEAAWERCVVDATRIASSRSEAREWMEALTATMVAWRAAYARQPPSRGDWALALVADGSDREPLDRGAAPLAGPLCPQCDAPVTEARTGRPRVYCGDACRRAHHAQLTRVAA